MLQVITILRLPARQNCPGETIFDRALEWVKFDEWNRAEEAPDILMDLNLASLPMEILRNRFEQEKVLRNVHCRKIYEEIMTSKEKAELGPSSSRAIRNTSGEHMGSGPSKEPQQNTCESTVSSSLIGDDSFGTSNFSTDEESNGDGHERPWKLMRFDGTYSGVVDESSDPFASHLLGSSPAEIGIESESVEECELVIKVEPFISQ